MSDFYQGPLLTQNRKLEKGTELGVMNVGLSLAPHSLSGYNVCQHSTEGCRNACVLWFAGMSVMPNARKAKIAKTKLLFEHRDVFVERLSREIGKWERKAHEAGLQLNIRLNTASDMPWEKMKFWGGKTVFESHSDSRFFDYTKIPDRMMSWCRGELPENYHLTFSRSGENDSLCLEVLELGGSVAVVFEQELPGEFWGYPVIDGDKTDSRYLDARGVIVGLREKGKRGKDDTGFVVRNDYTPLKVIQ